MTSGKAIIGRWPTIIRTVEQDAIKVVADTYLLGVPTADEALAALNTWEASLEGSQDRRTSSPHAVGYTIQRIH